jgi:undecaprenyl pyrophosphate phosphatase UppP
MAEVGIFSLFLGFVTAAAAAALAMREFVSYLTRRGLEPFGWYRMALAAVISMVGISR